MGGCYVVIGQFAKMPRNTRNTFIFQRAFRAKTKGSCWLLKPGTRSSKCLARACYLKLQKTAKNGGFAVSPAPCEKIHCFFRSWPEFVALGERISQFTPDFSNHHSPLARSELLRGLGLIIDGRSLLSYMAGVRVPMPKSIEDYFLALDKFDITCEEIGINSARA